MLTILTFIIVLSLLVFVHEMGHFLVARFYGVKAEEFGFGFPPRLAGVVYDEDAQRYRFILGNKALSFKNTIYSLNWLPLGGFVRIKGESGEEMDADSFAVQSAWRRIQILVAGVVMNMITAWFLFAAVMMMGAPQSITPEEAAQYENAKVQVLAVAQDSPAAHMGLQPGDQILSVDGTTVTTSESVSGLIQADQAQVTVVVDRFGEQHILKGTPGADGKIGISFADTAVVKSGFWEAMTTSFTHTWQVSGAILVAFGTLIKGLVMGGGASGADVTGPIGIVYLTKQVSDLGLVYLLQFAALLSINLAIINILPIPALDGGRILFILIEKIKGSPVTRATEGMIHQIGFLALIFLMIFITTRDVLKFELLQKFVGFLGF